MVTNPRTPQRPRRAVVGSKIEDEASRGAPKLRPLNQPRPIEVETDEHGAPTAIVVSKVRRAVDGVTEMWRIDDEWWHARRISRRYWRLFLEDGRTVDVYCDLVRDRWYRQAYAG